MSSLLIPIQMRFGDIDSYGHVNNVTMLQYLEDARVRLMARPLPQGAAAGAAIRGGTLVVVQQHHRTVLRPAPPRAVVRPLTRHG